VKIECAELWHVAMPLISPWRTAYGEDAAIHSVLVRMSANGVSGWGESCPLYAPTYSPESALSAYETCREFFLPRIVGKDFEGPQQLLDSLVAFRGNQFAKAAIETAWWALDCKTRAVPLWQALGGTQPRIFCGEDIGIQNSIDHLLALVENAAKRGYPRIKLKIRQNWDIEVLAAVRSSFPGLIVHVDCNGGYDLDEHWETLRKLDRFELAMIEQPLSDTDLFDHARLQNRIATPICLDESIKSPRDFRTALSMGACRAINVKPGRVGGLCNAVTIHDMARNAGITAWVGSMLESGVGAGICAALATLPGFTYPPDLFPSGRLYREDISASEIQLDERCGLDLALSAACEIEPDLDRLKRASVARCELRA